MFEIQISAASSDQSPETALVVRTTSIASAQLFS